MNTLDLEKDFMANSKEKRSTIKKMARPLSCTGEYFPSKLGRKSKHGLLSKGKARLFNHLAGYPDKAGLGNWKLGLLPGQVPLIFLCNIKLHIGMRATHT